MDRDAISFMNSSRDPRSSVILQRIAKVIDWMGEQFHASLGYAFVTFCYESPINHEFQRWSFLRIIPIGFGLA